MGSVNCKNDNVGGEELFHAGKESGFSEVLEDARGFNEVYKATLFESKEDQVSGARERKEEIR